MSEVQTNDQGKEGGKAKQKKQMLRVDFTPMVDMNMLLITFFMFCTTLLKPSTMNINMPTRDAPKDDTGNKVKESRAVTLLLGANDEIYYYLGMPKEDNSSYDDPDFLVPSAYGAEGVRKILLEKNSGTYEQIQELKKQLQDGVIPDSVFRQKSKEIQTEANKPSGTAPTVMIKPTEYSTYKNMVDALDEMLICNIGSYAIVDVSDGDRYLLYKKDEGKNSFYLTDAQRNQSSTPSRR